MARFAGGTVQIVTYATKPDGTVLVNADIDSATATVYSEDGTVLSTGPMIWDPVRVVWFYDWNTPSVVGLDPDYLALCTLVSTALSFTNKEWRSFSVKASPV